MTPEEMKKIQKQAVKEVAKEWLDQQFSKFGRWTLRAIGSAVFFAIVYALVNSEWFIEKILGKK